MGYCWGGSNVMASVVVDGGSSIVSNTVSGYMMSDGWSGIVVGNTVSGDMVGRSSIVVGNSVGGDMVGNSWSSIVVGNSVSGDMVGNGWSGIVGNGGGMHGTVVNS